MRRSIVKNVLVVLPDFSNSRLQTFAGFWHLPLISSQPFHLSLVRKLEFSMVLVSTNDTSDSQDRHPIGGENDVPFSDLNDELRKLGTVPANRRMDDSDALPQAAFFSFSRDSLLPIDPGNVAQLRPPDCHATSITHHLPKARPVLPDVVPISPVAMESAVDRIQSGREVIDWKADFLGRSNEATSTDISAITFRGQLQEFQQVEPLQVGDCGSHRACSERAG